LKYHSQILSEKNSYSFYIPEGFAHGYQSIADDVHLIYLHSTIYNKKKSAGLIH
jgi:dTDP-4-dehydrorhamnose 3,5-epimerase